MDGMTETLAPTGSALRHIPWWGVWAPRALLVWAVAYGALRTYWAAGHMPVWKFPTDLFLFSGWGAVVVCAVVAALCLALLARPASRALVVAMWAVSVAMVGCSAMLLLDVIGGILPGLGIPFQAAGLLSRGGMVTGALLAGATALARQRRLRSNCPHCGRTRSRVVAGLPRWAYVAGWVAVGGCVLRIAAQAAVGFGETPFRAGWAVIVFEVGFLLAGSVLPLLLVHSWGRVFPRWMLLLPGYAIGGGITAYFGVGSLQLLVETLSGEDIAFGQLPAAFFWVAVPAYVVWGAGLLLATVGYDLSTRRGGCRCAAPATPVMPRRQVAGQRA